MENVTQLAPGTLWTRGVRGRSTDDGTVAGAGGGTGIDANLTPPVLTLAVAGNVYPPQLDATLDVTWITGDNIRLQSCADISFGTTIIDNLHTITNAEAIASAISYGALLSGIISPTVTFFRARGEHAAGNSDWSNICLHGDVTAPTITSSAAVSNNEGSVLAHTLTANETIYTWTITGGVDSGDFEIAGTTLRWLSNGTKNYEAPDDSGTNNVYDVQVTATDYAGNASNQSIAVTVNDLNETPTGLVGFFTDVTGATASTLYTSANTYTVAGLAGGISVPITILDGAYSKNGAGYTSGAGTVTNGDTVQLELTSSAASGAVASAIVTIGGASDTWSVTTTGTFDPATLFGGGDTGGYWNISDLSTVWQDTAGTVPGAVGSPVLRIDDLSGKGNYFLWVSGNTLTLRQNGSFYYVEAGAANGLTYFSVALPQPWERISALQQKDWTAFDRVFGAVSSNGHLRQEGSTPQVALNDGTSTSVISPTLNTDCVISEVHNNTASTLQLNNNTAVTGTSGTNAGDGMCLFQTVLASRPVAGYFYGGVLITRTLTSGERQSMRTWCAALYGGTL